MDSAAPYPTALFKDLSFAIYEEAFDESRLMMTTLCIQHHGGQIVPLEAITENNLEQNMIIVPSVEDATHEQVVVDLGRKIHDFWDRYESWKEYPLVRTSSWLIQSGKEQKLAYALVGWPSVCRFPTSDNETMEFGSRKEYAVILKEDRARFKTVIESIALYDWINDTLENFYGYCDAHNGVHGSERFYKKYKSILHEYSARSGMKKQSVNRKPKALLMEQATKGRPRKAARE